MFNLPIFTTLLTATFALAQYGAPPAGPASPASSAPPPPAPSAPASNSTQINVNVAPNGQFQFNPNNITAANGTLITFFFPNAGIAHSVTQSSFADPCTYLTANGSEPAGFDSGLQQAVEFTINITDDSQPIWFHCKQVDHCGLGMVGAINAPTTGNFTFQNFMTSALAIGSNEATESDSGPVTGGVNGIATAAPSSDVGNAGSAKMVADIGLAVFAIGMVAMFL
ncbi:hypothetical protein BDN72DRAFT_315797 [Pluteus cervinus]|uniref:Uncharacterized protein n=1 Tax=Pluteus cervinus TaxID=181527 RepID=A0ACD3B3Z9_9AGAR|nr:hypothetical protein BDN72DRAFT_315797 [Pluteus cervinus]